MDIWDLIITPAYVIIILTLAYVYQKTNKHNLLIRKYFLGGLIVKIIGSLGVGLIYQFYYGYGDTLIFFKDSLVINDFLDHNPVYIFSFFFFDAGGTNTVFTPYAANFTHYYDPASFFLEKIVAFINLFTFRSYCTSAIGLALLSYSGIWKLFVTFCKYEPKLHKEFAISALFLPSVFFWGSGLLKDNLCIGAVGWLFYASYNIFVEKRRIILNFLFLLISSYILYRVKVYILMSFLIPLSLFIFLLNKDKIKNRFVKKIITPVFYVVPVFIGVYLIYFITKDDTKYNLENIVNTSQVTAQYIERISHKGDGSAYNIGQLNFNSPTATLFLFFNAIVVSLFRPFLWEVSNVVMLMAALEGMFFLFLTFLAFKEAGIKMFFQTIVNNYFVLFCFLFCMIFAFSIGVSSGNFGTLVRYKIPLMPFYASSIYMIRRINNLQKIQQLT